jgi:hypothetical protein
MGFHIESGAVSCWRCGKHGTIATVAHLLNCSYDQAGDIIKRYGGVSSYTPAEPIITTNTKPFSYPSGVGELGPNHIKYLTRRKFDPERLVHDWGLMGTGPASTLDNIDFKHRVIIPIIWDNQLVSFQGRDITNKSDLRYITCPETRERVHHKNILGGKQRHWGTTGIIVEGMTDVFRFGLKACCTFGIKYTAEQVSVIAHSFKRAVVCFDDEPQAVAQANELVSELRFRGLDTFRQPIVGDPGGMDQTEADYLVKQLLS